MRWHFQNFANRDFLNFFHASESKLIDLLAFSELKISKCLYKIAKIRLDRECNRDCWRNIAWMVSLGPNPQFPVHFPQSFPVFKDVNPGSISGSLGSASSSKSRPRSISGGLGLTLVALSRGRDRFLEVQGRTLVALSRGRDRFWPKETKSEKASKFDISPWRRIEFDRDTGKLFRKMGRMRWHYQNFANRDF